MALNPDAVSVLDSIDEDWQNFQIPNLGGDDDSPESQKKRGRGKAKAKATRASAPKSNPVPVKKANVKAKKVGPVKCRGCRKKILGDEVAKNFPGCWPCKRPLDNLAKLAARQRSEAQKFVEKCYQMVQSYMESCPENPDPTSCVEKRRGSWSLVKYIERVKAASGVIRDRVGEMMSKIVYLEFAPTARGGRKSAAEAEAQWLQWEMQVQNKDPEVLFDRRGPDGSLRVWVATRDL